MKRNVYYVKSYDGAIEKTYYNYKSAYNFCSKLIAKDVMCGIYLWNTETQKFDCIIGC